MGRRAYRMVARAEATESTRARIIDAAADQFLGRSFGEVTLAEVAAQAGVTLQTILRHFGSKEGLLDAAIAEKSAAVFASRRPAVAGDRAAAIRALVASYEEIGDRNWRLLVHEDREPIRRVLVNARRLHRQWLAENFSALLPVRGAQRERRLDALFTVTDFYVWKLHRRDLDRSRREVEATMVDLVEALARSWEGR